MAAAEAARAARAQARAKAMTAAVGVFMAKAVRVAFEEERNQILARWSSMDLGKVPFVKEALALERQ